MTVKTADVIIVGGGVHGASTAYELAKAGVKVVLFEKEYLGSGGSGRSAAGLRQHFGTETNLHMAKYNLQVFPTLEEELDTGMPLIHAVGIYGSHMPTRSLLSSRRTLTCREALTFPL